MALCLHTLDQTLLRFMAAPEYTTTHSKWLTVMHAWPLAHDQTRSLHDRLPKPSACARLLGLLWENIRMMTNLTSSTYIGKCKYNALLFDRLYYFSHRSLVENSNAVGLPSARLLSAVHFRARLPLRSLVNTMLFNEVA